jgi:L-amino acid N-acyltransferase YncA
MKLRLGTLDDASDLREIYNREVLETTNTFDIEPRTLEEQESWIAEREGALGVVVAEIDGRVVGFASLSPYRPRAAYRTTVENSVYVDQSARGSGVGRALMDELIDVATRRGFHTIVAHIAGGHEASIGLHHACGFQVVGTEREVGRKFGKWLDVIVMQRMLA